MLWRDTQLLQKLLVFVADKLTALIRVEDCWCAKSVHSVPHRLQDRLYTQGRGSNHNFPAVPVDDGREIHMVAVKLDISDVDKLYLILGRNGLVAQ